MKIIRLQQNTRPWHLWRAGGIGSSDAAALMGCHVDPKMNADALLAEKLGQRREVTFAMRRGLNEESPARLACFEALGCVLRPACIQHDEVDWLRASLDGLDFWGETVLEIKAPKIEHHEQALGGEVPGCYVAQLQHQLLVTGCDLAIYASWSLARRFGGPESPSLALVEVEPDAEYLAQLHEVEERFWERLCAARRGRVA